MDTEGPVRDIARSSRHGLFLIVQGSAAWCSSGSERALAAIVTHHRLMSHASLRVALQGLAPQVRPFRGHAAADDVDVINCEIADMAIEPALQAQLNITSSTSRKPGAIAARWQTTRSEPSRVAR
jgi:hypothetical protein